MNIYRDKEQLQKMWEDGIKPITCYTIADIKAAIQPFMEDSGGEQVLLSCKVGDEKVTGKSTASSMRQLLLEGLSVIKKRMEAITKVQEAVDEADEAGVSSAMSIWDINNVRFNIDNIIERRLGGKRRGIRIRWNLSDCIYEYDPFSNKLYKIEE